MESVVAREKPLGSSDGLQHSGNARQIQRQRASRKQHHGSLEPLASRRWSAFRLDGGVPRRLQFLPRSPDGFLVQDTPRGLGGDPEVEAEWQQPDGDDPRVAQAWKLPHTARADCEYAGNSPGLR